MLNHQLIHPEINAILGRAGHHGKVLIADGNYPASTERGSHAEVVSLNLAPGLLTATAVLDVILTAIPVEAASAMGYPADDAYTTSEDPPIWAEYQKLLNKHETGVQLDTIQKWDFYKAASGSDHVLTIQTGEQAIFANLLLTIGVRQD